MNRTTVFATIGTPGCGKSTWADSKDARVICPDLIRKEITGDESDLSQDDFVWQTAYHRLSSTIGFDIWRFRRNPIIFDSTMANSDRRREFVTFCRLLGANVVGVYFKTPIEVSIERNAARDRKVPVEVIARMWSDLRYRPPSTDEGFRRLYVVE